MNTSLPLLTITPLIEASAFDGVYGLTQFVQGKTVELVDGLTLDGRSPDCP